MVLHFILLSFESVIELLLQYFWAVIPIVAIVGFFTNQMFGQWIKLKDREHEALLNEGYIRKEINALKEAQNKESEELRYQIFQLEQRFQNQLESKDQKKEP